ncbi:MAG: citrate synthase [Planctomycetes bacterium]|nr:citrate synthase [Planctomycetota bacterium]
MANTASSEELRSGLVGVVSNPSSISSIIEATLTYRGINIDDLTDNGTFEEITYLLWHGRLPNRAELDELSKGLAGSFTLPDGVIACLQAMPKDTDPMRVLQAGAALLGMYDPDADSITKEANLRKATRLTSQLTALTCAFHRIRNGNDPIPPSDELSFAGNFFYQLNGKKPDAIETEAIDKALILHADHELNASTFAGRVTASTRADMHSAIASAIGTLKGPLHGGANRAVMESLKSIGSVDNVEPWLKDKLAKKEKIMGFGHRVYKHGDPRAKHLKVMSKKLGELTGQAHWYEISVKLDELFTAQKPLPPNVDFYSASTYYCLGLPADLYTPIFACSRVTGWIAHLFEQYEEDTLIRPRALYTGAQTGNWVPIDER